MDAMGVEEPMSKLAHSNQETMDKIERDRRKEDGESMVEPMTREELVSELNRFRDLYVAAEASRAQALVAENARLKERIASVNNSVFGSDGFFMEPNCVDEIERGKRLTNEAYRLTFERAESAESSLATAVRERDLAIAHDRQPYPTAWAYEQACKSLEEQRQRADAAVRERDELKARLSAMFPLFEEARDALTAIPLASAKLHNVRLDLADRMDGVGDPKKWAAR